MTSGTLLPPHAYREARLTEMGAAVAASDGQGAVDILNRISADGYGEFSRFIMIELLKIALKKAVATSDLGTALRVFSVVDGRDLRA